VYAVIPPLNNGETTLLSQNLIPKPVLSYIFAHVNDLSSMSAIARVCKLWYAATQSATLWRMMMDSMFENAPVSRAWWLENEKRLGMSDVVTPNFRDVCREWYLKMRASYVSSCEMHYPCGTNSFWSHVHGVRAVPDAKLRDLSSPPKKAQGR
jgi:hypothetical protein